jgi:hypothetical protein
MSVFAGSEIAASIAAQISFGSVLGTPRDR